MNIKDLKLQRLKLKYPNIDKLVNIITNLEERTFHSERGTFYYYGDKLVFQIDYTYQGFDEITFYFEWFIYDMFKEQIKYTEFDIFMHEILSNLTEMKDLDKFKYAGKALLMFQKSLEKDEQYYK